MVITIKVSALICIFPHKFEESYMILLFRAAQAEYTEQLVSQLNQFPNNPR